MFIGKRKERPNSETDDAKPNPLMPTNDDSRCFSFSLMLRKINQSIVKFHLVYHTLSCLEVFQLSNRVQSSICKCTDLPWILVFNLIIEMI